jgi:hypothetical protein
VRMSGIAKLASPYLCLAWRPCTVFGKCHWSFGMVCSGNSSAMPKPQQALTPLLFLPSFPRKLLIGKEAGPCGPAQLYGCWKW